MTPGYIRISVEPLSEHLHHTQSKIYNCNDNNNDNKARCFLLLLSVLMKVAVRRAEEVVEQPHMRRRDGVAGGGDTTDSSSDEHEINGVGSGTPVNGNTKLSLSHSDYSPYPAEKDINFPKLMNAVIDNQHMLENNSKDKTLKASTSLTAKETNVSADHEYDTEEIEMEFERSFQKVYTHTPVCPNCKSQITKVVMRRKIKKPMGTTRPAGEQDLYGCLSCLRFFFRPGADEGKPPVSKIPEPSPPDVVVPIPGTGTSGAGDDHGHGSDYKSLEILKCIIYGGLMETITSMSVVSSAAASDATMLSVLAIGFATVISSTFIFWHNLRDMKNESPREISNQQVGRYEELIGKKENFLLHTTFGMLSFLIFGLIPPTAYAFAFRESNKDYKIIEVAAASFACVFALATGKAYVGGKKKLNDYVKTILYYTTMAVCVSGVAYAAGNLIELLMERLGWFETTPSASDNAAAAWASY